MVKKIKITSQEGNPVYTTIDIASKSGHLATMLGIDVEDKKNQETKETKDKSGSSDSSSSEEEVEIPLPNIKKDHLVPILNLMEWYHKCSGIFDKMFPEDQDRRPLPHNTMVEFIEDSIKKSDKDYNKKIEDLGGVKELNKILNDILSVGFEHVSDVYLGMIHLNIPTLQKLLEAFLAFEIKNKTIEEFNQVHGCEGIKEGDTERLSDQIHGCEGIKEGDIDEVSDQIFTDLLLNEREYKARYGFLNDREGIDRIAWHKKWDSRYEGLVKSYGENTPELLKNLKPFNLQPGSTPVHQ